MTRASCRCGQSLSISKDDPDRVVCPQCGARVRIRRPAATAAEPAPGDGFLRFFCPCGRRLKVSAQHPPAAGKCPDCGRVVPVPTAGATAGPDDRTVDLTPADLAALDRWSQEHRARPRNKPPGGTSTADIAVPAQDAGRVEVGLRVCPQCGKPVHLGAENCRNCGAAVPKR